MRMWEIKESDGPSRYGRRSDEDMNMRNYRGMRGMRNDDEAYECGYEDGYRDAMKEAKHYYGERRY